MKTLQQQKDEIDKEALRVKAEADKTAFDDRQAAAELEINNVNLEAAAKIKQIRYDAQR